MTARRPGRPPLPPETRAQRYTITLYLSQRRWLEYESKRRGCTMSAVVQKLIDKAAWEDEERKVARAVAEYEAQAARHPDAAEEQGASDETSRSSGNHSTG